MVQLLMAEHVWYVDEHNNGHIIFVKPLTKSKIPKVIVTHWKINEAEEGGENVTYQWATSVLHCG